VSPGAAASIGELAIGLRGAGAVRGRLVGTIAGPSTQGMEPARVRLATGAARLELSWRWGEGDWWLEPGVGAGVVATRATPVDLEQGRAITRWHPLLCAGAAIGRQLVGAWSARAEIGGSVHPRGDEYVIDPAGVVGRTPLGAVSVGLGLQWESNR
jgi:hypothetical protein